VALVVGDEQICREGRKALGDVIGLQSRSGVARPDACGPARTRLARIIHERTVIDPGLLANGQWCSGRRPNSRCAIPSASAKPALFARFVRE